MSAHVDARRPKRAIEPATRRQNPQDRPLKTGPDLQFLLSGWGDLNSQPSVPQIDQPQSRDLRKRPETASGLQFWLITGSRRFALFRGVSRPVRGLKEGLDRILTAPDFRF